MNNVACNNATNQPVSLKNKATPDATVFASAAPAPTSDAVFASTIVPDAHIPLSGQKQHTKPFSPVRINKMENKDTMDTTPAPNAPTVFNVYASSQSHVLIVPNSPY